MAPFSQDFSECSADGGARHPPGTRYTGIVPYIYRQTVNKTRGACGFCVKTDGKLPQNFQKSGNDTCFFRPCGSHPTSCARRRFAPGRRQKTERAQQKGKCKPKRKKTERKRPENTKRAGVRPAPPPKNRRKIYSEKLPEKSLPPNKTNAACFAAFSSPVYSRASGRQ